MNWGGAITAAETVRIADDTTIIVQKDIILYLKRHMLENTPMYLLPLGNYIIDLISNVSFLGLVLD